MSSGSRTCDCRSTLMAAALLTAGLTAPRQAWSNPGNRRSGTREPRGHALALGLKMWMVSPRASISTSWAIRLARVSGFTAV